MNQVSCIPLAGVAIVAIIIILLSNCVVCHEKSANVYRKRRLTNDDTMQLEQRQQQQQQKTSVEPNTDQRYNDNNMFKDRLNSDKIVFDRRPTTTITTTTERTPTASMTINNNNPMKSNETNHQYSGTANGEYQFRWVHFIYLFISKQTTKTNNYECACFFTHHIDGLDTQLDHTEWNQTR